MLSEANDNINVPATIEADLILAAPVAQNLQGIELVVQGPVAQGEDAGVGIILQIQPAPIAPGPINAQHVPIVQGPVDIQPAPVVQGPVDAPPAIPLPLDGDNNNDSSEDETDIIMTDRPPGLNRSLQGIRSDTWQRFDTMSPGFAGNSLNNVFLFPQPRRSVV